MSHIINEIVISELTLSSNKGSPLPLDVFEILPNPYTEECHIYIFLIVVIDYNHKAIIFLI